MEEKPLDTGDCYQRLGEAWWDKRAALSTLHAIHPVTLRYFMQALGEGLKGIRLLDVGCGGGLLAEGFARAGALVTGIDVSEGAIDTARRHAAREGLAIDYRVGSAEDMRLPDESFDAVLASFVLEHVNDRAQAIASMARVLKPEGLFLYSAINRSMKTLVIITWIYQYVQKRVPPGTLNWRKFIRPQELERLLRAQGVCPIETKGVARQYPYPSILARKLIKSPPGGFVLTRDMKLCYVGYAIKGPRHSQGLEGDSAGDLC